MVSHTFKRLHVITLYYTNSSVIYVYKYTEIVLKLPFKLLLHFKSKIYPSLMLSYDIIHQYPFFFFCLKSHRYTAFFCLQTIHNKTKTSLDLYGFYKRIINDVGGQRCPIRFPIRCFILWENDEVLSITLILKIFLVTFQ